MRKEKFPAKELLSLFKRKKVSDLAEIKEALGTQSTMTAFQKLKQLCYFTSYSHRGRYYTFKGHRGRGHRGRGGIGDGLD